MKRNVPEGEKRTASTKRRSAGLAAPARGLSEATSSTSDNAEASAGNPSHTSSSDSNRNRPQHAAAALPPRGAGGVVPNVISVTYPNPKSFAERLMKVLETRAVPDTIWWEDDGKIVALHVEKLKKGTVLAEHFNNIKYKFFIRYFSRWGFRRITDFSVPYGLFYYRNSMFQKDRPHLVKHMRMDSNVQNVFAEHESAYHIPSPSNNEDPNPRDDNDDPQEDVEAPSADPDNRSARQHHDNGHPQPEIPRQIDPALLQNMIRLAHPQAQQNNNLSEHNYGQNQNDNSGSFPPPPPPARGEDEVFTELLSQLMHQVHQTNQHHGPEMNRIARQLLLQQILRLSREYLEQSEVSSREYSPSSPHETSLRSIMMVLMNMGQPFLLHHLQLQPQQANAGGDNAVQQRFGALANSGASGAQSLLPLLLQLSSGMQGQGQQGSDQADEATRVPSGQFGGGSGMHQQPQNPPPVPPQHQQQHVTAGDAAGDSQQQQQALQELIAGMLGGGAGLQQQQQRHQNPPPGPPQQHQQQPPPNPDMVDPQQLQQLLAVLQQQQQQQGE